MSTLPTIGQLSLYDNIYRDYKNRDKIDTLKKYFDVPYLLPQDFESDIKYLKYLEPLISNAYAYACLGHYNKSLAYYSTYQDKTIKINQIKNKLVSLINEIIGHEKCISDFDSIWFELSRISSIKNFEYKSLYDRVRNYKENKEKQDIISRRNILVLLIKNIEEVYNSEVKRMIDKPTLTILRSEKNFGVEFDTIENRYNIFGRSFSNKEDKFWDKVLNWTQKNKLKFSGSTLTVNIEYFGSISAKCLYQLIQIFNINGCKIVWKYDKSNDTVLESGKDFEELCMLSGGTKFEFVQNTMQKIDNKPFNENYHSAIKTILENSPSYKDWLIEKIKVDIDNDGIVKGTFITYTVSLKHKKKNLHYPLVTEKQVIFKSNNGGYTIQIDKKSDIKNDGFNRDGRIKNYLKSTILFKDWSIRRIEQLNIDTYEVIVDKSGFNSKKLNITVDLKKGPWEVFSITKDVVLKLKDNSINTYATDEPRIFNCLKMHDVYSDWKVSKINLISDVTNSHSHLKTYSIIISPPNKNILNKKVDIQILNGVCSIIREVSMKPKKNYSDRGDI